MKKFLLACTLAVVTSLSASAQFEKGKIYVGANMTGVGLSYSDKKDLAFGAGAEVGQFLEQDWLAIAEAGFNYQKSDWQSLYVGLKGRYYIEQNGLWLGAGIRLQHEFKNDNDFLFTPEVGYAFFVSRTVTIQPSVYLNLSCADFSHNTEFGVKVGVGLYF